MKNLYIIDYENAHYCGGQLNVLVWALDETDAEVKAENWMEENQRELFADEYGESVSEDEEYADECAYSVNSVQVFDSKHDEWKFYLDEDQSSFYPVCN